MGRRRRGDALGVPPGQSLPLAFLPIPGLVWGALRLGLRTVAIQLIVVGALTVRLTIIGGGPFAAAARVTAASVRRPSAH